MRSEVTTAGNPTSLAAHNTGGGNHHPALLPSGTNPYQRTNVDNAAQQAGVQMEVSDSCQESGK